MRALPLTAPLLGALALLLWAAPGAVPQGHPGPRAGSGSGRDKAPGAYEADCRTEINGSRAYAYCHNPYPSIDVVRLHVECERWWDLDMDSAPAVVGPAEYVELTDRCWKEVRAVWITHQPAAAPADR
jgi:hypothetical protein